jgi:sugar phosphate isomerase/epimerase
MQFYFMMTVVFLALTSCQQKSSDVKTQKQEEPEISSRFSYSLAQWSLHRALEDKTLDPLDFASKAKELGFTGIEYVSSFYAEKVLDTMYMAELKKRAEQNNIQSLIIMVDGEGDLAVMDEQKRNEAVENHYKWVDAAGFLGCHSIRVNLFGTGTETEMADASVLALKKLSVYGKQKNINIIVENHGGQSSHGVWLKSVISRVNMPNCGTLPDFGNFCLQRENNERWNTPCTKEYDRYKGIKELIPYAKGVSAKSYGFDASGNETTIDYALMAEIVKASDFQGFVGVEWEGNDISEEEGIKKTLELVKKHFN